MESSSAVAPCSFAPSQSFVIRPVMSPTWNATCMSGNARNRYRCWNLWNHFFGCRASKRNKGMAVCTSWSSALSLQWMWWLTWWWYRHIREEPPMRSSVKPSALFTHTLGDIAPWFSQC